MLCYMCLHVRIPSSWIPQNTLRKHFWPNFITPQCASCRWDLSELLHQMLCYNQCTLWSTASFCSPNVLALSKEEIRRDWVTNWTKDWRIIKVYAGWEISDTGDPRSWSGQNITLKNEKQRLNQRLSQFTNLDAEKEPKRRDPDSLM